MNFHDVANLNAGIDAMGTGLLHSRMLDQQQQQNQAANALKSQELEVQQNRVDVDQSFRDAQLKHYQNMEDKAGEGAVNVWLQGPEGGVFNYQGRPEGLDAMKTKAEEAGMSLDVVDQPKTPPTFGTIEKVTSDGSRLRWYARDQSEFDMAGKAAAAMPGFTPPQKPGAAAVQVMGQVQDYLQKAQDAEDAGDKDSADHFRDAAEVLKGTLKKREPTPAPGLKASVTTDDPKHPGNKRTTSGPKDLVDAATAEPAPIDPKLRTVGTLYRLPNKSLGIWQPGGWQPQGH